MTSTSPYVSTTCLQGRSYRETLEEYANAGIEKVELSYCSDTSIEIEQIVEHYPFEFIAHNYCFPNHDEFILNLASQNEIIRERSVRYICNAIKRCEELAIGTYSFHAGFRVDPNLEMKFPNDGIAEYRESFETFVTSIETILARVGDLDVNLAVENNVVNPGNVVKGSSLLLLSQPGEFKEFYDYIDPNDIGVLLDVGHLNVSAKSLDYAKEDLVEEVQDYVRLLHVHWNDKKRDQHRPITGKRFASTVREQLPDVPVSIESNHNNIEQLEKDIEWIQKDEQ